MSTATSVLKGIGVVVALVVGAIGSFFAWVVVDTLHDLSKRSAYLSDRQMEIYKPGSAGYLVNKIANNIGFSSPVFVYDAEDASRFMADLVDDQIVIEELKQGSEACPDPRATVVVGKKANRIDTLAYAQTKDAQSYCGIVITEHLKREISTLGGAILVHELTHCEQAHLRYTKPKQLDLEGIAKVIGKGLPDDIVQVVYAESLPTAMERSLSYRSDEVGSVTSREFHREYQDAMRNGHWVEAPNVALVLPGICNRAGACPQDLLELQDMLLHNDQYKAALRADMERWSRLKVVQNGVIASSK